MHLLVRLEGILVLQHFPPKLTVFHSLGGILIVSGMTISITGPVLHPVLLV